MREAALSNRTGLPAVSVEASGTALYRNYQTFKPITWAEIDTQLHFLTVLPKYAAHVSHSLHECTCAGVCVSLCVCV